jgi:hypothetical protein
MPVFFDGDQVFGESGQLLPDHGMMVDDIDGPHFR